MANLGLNQLDDLIGGAFSLNPDVFQTVVRLPQGQTVSLLVVLFAGLSLSVGQSIILFANQVKPVRFILSLILNAILFVFGFLFLVLSTWLIGWLPGFVRLPWGDLVIGLGLGYAPLLFSFLGAMPYAGAPVLNLLSVWHLLAMVVGVSAIAQISAGSAFAYVALGWFALHLLRGTIGQPIARIGQSLTRRVAAVEVVRKRSELAERLDAGMEMRLASAGAAPSLSPSEPSLGSGGRSALPPPQELPPPSFSAVASPSASAAVLPMESPDNPQSRFVHWLQSIPQLIQLAAILLGMILLFLLVGLLLRPIRNNLFGWYETLPRLFRWLFDLTWIGVVAMVFAGLLAPLETLGWWAGWFGDGVETDDSDIPTPRTATAQNADISRYMVYLDGVGQSGEAYTPDVVDFIEALQLALPKDVAFVQGLIMYSVRNQSLVENRPLAWVWRLADQMRWENPMALLGFMVNLRNAWVVAVSADKRYGPIYNQGIAQILYNGLVRQGYQPGDRTPITLLGYSGGAQMAAAAAPYLKRALGADIEVISLGGVMSANNQFLKLGHLYHLVGEKDSVEALGPFLFPGRREFFGLSYWNRAMRKGKITEVNLGPMGHQVPGGIMDPQAFLPDGESHLNYTISVILSILEGRLLVTAPQQHKRPSNYELYKQADFNDYRYYPLDQAVDGQWYRPIAPWMGRLILPQLDERDWAAGVWFEVHHADRGYESLVGQRVLLRWAEDPTVQQWVRAVTQDVHFSVDAEYSSQYGGTVHPDRLNHWQQVDPLESLAGFRPTDDGVVMLDGMVRVEGSGSASSPTGQEAASPIHSSTARLSARAEAHSPIHTPHPTPHTPHPILSITTPPTEITGRYYALVRFEGAIANTDRYQIRHFNPVSRQFDGLAEEVRLPEVVRSPGKGSYPSTSQQIERSPLNEMGWYIYGAKDAAGWFVVQSLAPRSLLRLQPDRVVFGSRASYRYVRQEAWADAVAQKGRVSSVLCVGHRRTEQIQEAIDEWKVGDRALLLHVYGGIGGNNKEPAAATPIFFGHFSYGIATVVQDPFTDERRFEINYLQVYSHNTDGIISGTLHWSRYMGDRQFGWLGTRPVCDILIKFEPFTGEFEIHGRRRSPLSLMVTQLNAMTARYRIGDGTGATYVGPANNCAQDSNQALFASIRALSDAIATNQTLLQEWLATNPAQAQDYQQLLDVSAKLDRKLRPLGSPRPDWEANVFNLGTTLEDDPLRNLWFGLGSWRSLLPRKASDAIVQVFLEHGASVWVLRTNQVGGHDPDIEPIVPITF